MAGGDNKRVITIPSVFSNLSEIYKTINLKDVLVHLAIGIFSIYDFV